MAFVASLWVLYRYRMHQLGRQFDLRLEERLGERTRIARDLHDTMLQSFQGSVFEFQAVQKLLSNRPEEAKPALDRAIDSARSAIAEGRDAIQGLRPGSGDTTGVQRALPICSERWGNNVWTLRHKAKTKQHSMSPWKARRSPWSPSSGRTLPDRPGSLRNAFRHARAKQIEVEFGTPLRSFAFAFATMESGLIPKCSNTGARPGHWGLPGVRERAKLIGAKFDLWSQAMAGAEVQITVPASLAYLKSRTFRAFRLLRRKAGSYADS